mgnify:CR=1 FL=1
MYALVKKELLTYEALQETPKPPGGAVIARMMQQVHVFQLQVAK